jgi:hypothetical protein
MATDNPEVHAAVHSLLDSLDEEGRMPPEKAPDAKPGEKPEPKVKPAKQAANDDEVQLDGDPILPDDNAADDDPDASDDEKKDDEAGGVDYKQKIPLGDGRSITLGELKDAYQDSAARELEVQERETKMIEQSVEMQRILKYFDCMPPQLRYRAAQDIDDHVRRESEGVMDVIPSWRHESARAADTILIQELASSYGMRAEIEAELRFPTDRRIVKMVRDFARLRAHVKQARAKAELAPKPSSQIKPVRNDGAGERVANLQQRAKTTRNASDQLKAVEALLGD